MTERILLVDYENMQAVDLEALPDDVILSKDRKGFDPLVRHLTVERGFKVRRVSAQEGAFEEISGTTLKTPFERLIWLLKKEKVLPRKRKGLEGKVRSWFPGNFGGKSRRTSGAVVSRWVCQRIRKEGTHVLQGAAEGLV